MISLDQGKQRAGDIAKEELLKAGRFNSAVNMAISGARGSMDNLTMMAASIGQAKVRGKRLEEDTKIEYSLISLEVLEVLKRKVSYHLHLNMD